jgi:hypothetical protein
MYDGYVWKLVATLTQAYQALSGRIPRIEEGDFGPNVTHGSKYLIQLNLHLLALYKCIH